MRFNFGDKRLMQFCFGQHSYGGPHVISRAIAHAKLFSRSNGAVSAKRRPNGRQIRFSDMKKTIYLLAMLGLFAACEQKTTTVNPPADKKESNTTIVNPPSEKKETKTDINVNTSPNP
jgi:hypothetical protein